MGGGGCFSNYANFPVMNLNTINTILSIFALLFVAVSIFIIVYLFKGGILEGERMHLLIQCSLLLVCSIWLWLVICATIKKKRRK